MKGTLTKLPRAEQWADRICVQLGESVEAIIETGRLLVKAKADLHHGEWERMFADGDGLVPFTRSTANRFMLIAGCALLSNRAHGHALPPSWRTLYELTKADPIKLKNALKDGLITPDIKRRDVKALLPSNGTKKHQAEEDNETRHHDVVQRALAAIQMQLDGFWDQYPSQQPAIQAAISSWDTYFSVKRQAGL